MVNQLENSIYILSKINSKIQHCLDTVVSVGIEYDIKEEQIQTLTYTALEHGLILVVSYIDEYNNHFSICLKNSKPPAYCKKLWNVIKVIHNEINKLFPDLKDFRNHFLAHNYRVDRKENIFLNAVIRTYQVPQNIADYILLTTLINKSHTLFKNEFPEAFDNVRKVINEQSNGIMYINPIVKDSEGLNNYLAEFSTRFQRVLNQNGLPAGD